MGQDELIRALEEESLSEIRRMMEEARADSAEMVARAEAEAQAASDEREAALKAELASLRAGRMNRATAVGRGLLLEARHRLLKRAFEEALVELAGGDDRKTLKRLYDELKAAVNQSSFASYDLFVNPADVGFFKEMGVEARPDAAVAHGVVIRSLDGEVTFENTFKSRLEKKRKRLEPIIDAILCGAG
jgi:vacuolar-type H+-ATPase subunit E/Vma4